MTALSDIRELRELAREVTFAPGDMLLREGVESRTFYVLQDGAVAIETHIERRGDVTIETLHAGDLVGWSWLFPGQPAAFSARVTEPTRALAWEADDVVGRCAGEPAFETIVVRAVLEVVAERLRETRLRLLDLYAAVPGGVLG